jgi:hypothetical protein
MAWGGAGMTGRGVWVLDAQRAEAGVGIARPLPAALPVVPPRLSFAGFCFLCSAHGCADSACVSEFAELAWVLCPVCDGSGLCLGMTGTPCAGCFYGLVWVPAVVSGVWSV